MKSPLYSVQTGRLEADSFKKTIAQKALRNACTAFLRAFGLSSILIAEIDMVCHSHRFPLLISGLSEETIEIQHHIHHVDDAVMILVDAVLLVCLNISTF